MCDLSTSSFATEIINLRCHREICPSVDLLNLMELLKSIRRSQLMSNLAQCLLLNLLLKTSRAIAIKCYYYLRGSLPHHLMPKSNDDTRL